MLKQYRWRFFLSAFRFFTSLLRFLNKEIILRINRKFTSSEINLIRCLFLFITDAPLKNDTFSSLLYSSFALTTIFSFPFLGRQTSTWELFAEGFISAVFLKMKYCYKWEMLTGIVFPPLWIDGFCCFWITSFPRLPSSFVGSTSIFNLNLHLRILYVKPSANNIK